jgi:pimeloyl-ACP methyl ester carboxylesterase
METKYAAVNGVRLAYTDIGVGARPLVLVHGFTGSRDDFGEQLGALGSVGRTILLDQRGHGESTNTGDPDTYTFDQLVEDLAVFLDELEIDRCDLLGHSMGGMVVLRFVLAHPERVASLLLMDTSARAPDGFPRAPVAAAGTIARAEGMANLATLLRARAADDPRRPAAAKRLEAEMGAERFWERHHRRLTAMDPEAFATLGVLLVDQTPVTERLAEITCPTLVIVGEQDAPFRKPAEEFVERIPNSTCCVIPDAAHSPQLENPELWFTAVRGHLLRVRTL